MKNSNGLRTLSRRDVTTISNESHKNSHKSSYSFHMINLWSGGGGWRRLEISNSIYLKYISSQININTGNCNVAEYNIKRIISKNNKAVKPLLGSMEKIPTSNR